MELNITCSDTVHLYGPYSETPALMHFLDFCCGAEIIQSGNGKILHVQFYVHT